MKALGMLVIVMAGFALGYARRADKLAVQSSEAGLTAAEAAQLKEIAITECGVTAQDVSIVEIK